uniref:Hypothetical secreted protein n=1 Tax=Ornithodoros coriaceus TaxID=92741 RepID=B2D2B3_ORNCO|nr:hypothetical secreted protein precursor [Ornithodoros coriaceus]
MRRRSIVLAPCLSQVLQWKVTSELIDDIAKDFDITFASKVSVKEVRPNDLVAEQYTLHINGPFDLVFMSP